MTVVGLDVLPSDSRLSKRLSQVVSAELSLVLYADLEVGYS